MSITSRARTRPRAEAIVAHLAAHEDFAALIADDKLTVTYLPSPNAKHGLDKRLEITVGRIKGMLITVTPVGGNNSATGGTKVENATRLAVNIWSRPVLGDTALPDPADMADEVQRVLQGYAPPHGDGGERHPMQALRVAAWVEVPDPAYLNHEIQITTLIPLGKVAG